MLYTSSRVFQFYHSNYLLDNEAVVNIYPNLPNDEMDEYFGIPKGTFNSQNHFIVYSFGKSDGYLLDYYYNLPVYNYNNLKNLDCNETFSKEKHNRFEKNEIIDNAMLYVRMLNKKNSNNFYTDNLSKSIVAVKIVNINFQYGKINNIIIDKNGVSEHCR